MYMRSFSHIHYSCSVVGRLYTALI